MDGNRTGETETSSLSDICDDTFSDESKEAPEAIQNQQPQEVSIVAFNAVYSVLIITKQKSTQAKTTSPSEEAATDANAQV